MGRLRATYRLQFGPDFTFDQASALVPYLSSLGISHIYASPIFAARTGSRHGYDVVDHGRVSDELGGEARLQRLSARLRAAGMGLILDIVPNHAGVGSENNHWLGLLEFGAVGPDSRWFDVDWARGPLIVPVLGETLGEAVAAGKLQAGWDPERGQLAIRYHDQQLPLAPTTLARLLDAAAPIRKDCEFLPALARSWAELASGAPTRDMIETRRRALRAAFDDLPLHALILEMLEQELTDPDEGMTAQRRLFDEQSWRLGHWRIARDELNYRRFFSISDLAALRTEDPEIFDAIHALPLRLLQQGIVDGLRVDHVDGLADPTGYCRTLRDAVGPGVTIHVEKILAREESLRPWPVDGTTGYELTNLINGLFIDPQGYARLAEHAAELGLSPPSDRIAERVATAKREILDHGFVTELGKLTKLAKMIADRSLQTTDLTEEALRRGISDLLVAFPVYRAYRDAGPCDPEDRLLIEAAAALAPAAADPWLQRVRDFVQAVLVDGADDDIVVEFCRRFQQLTAPLMAKGYEDTELYRHIVLLSANEVGGYLDHPAVSIDEFHARVAKLATDWPLNLIPLATHDTKWGADTRATLNVLSEIPEQWIATTETWSSLTAAQRVTADGEMPTRLDEMRILQTLFGAWPLSAERLDAYLLKAIREAREHGSWEAPDEVYEAATRKFARQLFDSADFAVFRRELEALWRATLAGARLNGLAQTIIQLTIPGVPDIYWGGEFWDHSLVDPDNRGAVDWGRRVRALENAPPESTALVIGDAVGDLFGSVKQALVQRLLRLRQRLPALFESGDYRPLRFAGEADETARWLGYGREAEGAVLIVIVPVRGMTASALPGVGRIRLDLPQAWQGLIGRDVFSNARIDIGPALDLAGLVSANSVAVIIVDRGADRGPAVA